MFEPDFDPLETLEQTVAQLNTNTRQIKQLVDGQYNTSTLLQQMADNNQRLSGLVEWQTREIEILKHKIEELERAVK